MSSNGMYLSDSPRIVEEVFDFCSIEVVTTTDRSCAGAGAGSSEALDVCDDFDAARSLMYFSRAGMAGAQATMTATSISMPEYTTIGT